MELIAIVGPTASGKTHKAVALAKRIGGEIISADSRQLYRGMDIGTGKDLEEYGTVPYHLIDICPAGYKYNLYEYLRDCDKAVAEIRQRGNQPIVCGGTGLYVESYLKGVRLPEVPENKALRERLEAYSLEDLTAMLAEMKTLHNTTDVDTKKRAIRAIEIQRYYIDNPDIAQKAEPHPVENALIVGVDIDREARRRRITERLHARLEEGMVDEIRRLLDSGVAADDLTYYGLEYKFVTAYATGQLTYDEMVSQLEIAIHQFAKRQMTWFRGMERRGFKINWLPYDMPDADFAEAVVGMMKMKKINFIKELWPLCDFFFIAPEAYDREDKFVRKNWTETAAADMAELAALLEGLDDFSVEGQKAAVDRWAEETGKKPWNPWRVALVGTGKGPDMYELSAFLGKEETLRRMRKAVEILK